MNSNLLQIKELIENLTPDEDLRQELWLHFLSGAATSSFENHLETIRIHNRIINELQQKTHIFVRLSDDKIATLLENFPDIEKSIIYLLSLGLDPLEISKYKGISLVMINQAILSINLSKVWNELK